MLRLFPILQRPVNFSRREQETAEQRVQIGWNLPLLEFAETDFALEAEPDLRIGQQPGLLVDHRFEIFPRQVETRNHLPEPRDVRRKAVIIVNPDRKEEKLMHLRSVARPEGQRRNVAVFELRIDAYS